MPPFLVTPPFILLIKPFCCYICHRCFTLSLPGALKNGEEISYYLFGRRGYTRGGILACLWSQRGSYPSRDTAAPANFISYSREMWLSAASEGTPVFLFPPQGSEESIASFPKELKDQNLIETAQFRENWSSCLFLVPTICWLASISYLVIASCFVTAACVLKVLVCLTLWWPCFDLFLNQ